MGGDQSLKEQPRTIREATPRVPATRARGLVLYTTVYGVSSDNNLGKGGYHGSKVKHNDHFERETELKYSVFAYVFKIKSILVPVGHSKSCASDRRYSADCQLLW